MESSSTQESVRMLNRRVANHLKMKNGWRNYLIYLHPFINADCFANIGNFLAKIKGLASGGAATSHNNHAIASLGAYALKQYLKKGGKLFKNDVYQNLIRAPGTTVYGDGSPLTREAHRCFVQYNISIKVELVTASSLFPIVTGKHRF